MKQNPRSDLALERRRADPSVPGTLFSEEKEGGFTVSRLRITEGEATEALGRGCGEYVTVSFPAVSLMGDSERGALVRLLQRELSVFYRRLCGEGLRELDVLLVGLGNARFTCDSLGPAVAARLPATAHLRELDPQLFRSLGCAGLRILVPGVLSDSGIEAAELTAALCERRGPALVIARDALMARDPGRLLKTVQISDSGISPGSGVGGGRARLDTDTLGIPVLAIGVPTVIDYPELGNEPMLVTPREIEGELSAVSELLARALSELLHLPPL